ncbi:MAG TPA: hypothetical protein VKZ46_05190 [Pedomonas sp.]|nr:hypothetical protein [Pedomonas sp.]
MSTEPFLDAPRSVQELHRQMDVQTTTWRIQRIGWWVLLLFSLAGAAGVLGGGPLAETTARTGARTGAHTDAQAGGAQLRYERVLRRGGTSWLHFDMAARGGQAMISLPPEYTQAVEITDLQPEPAESFTGPEGLVFVFAAPHERAQVRMKIRPRRAGLLNFAPIVNGEPLNARHPLVLP